MFIILYTPACEIFHGPLLKIGLSFPAIFAQERKAPMSLQKKESVVNYAVNPHGTLSFNAILHSEIQVTMNLMSSNLNNGTDAKAGFTFRRGMRHSDCDSAELGQSEILEVQAVFCSNDFHARSIAGRQTLCLNPVFMHFSCKGVCFLI